MQRVDRVVSREAEVVEDQLSRNGIELIQGEARFDNPHTVTVMSNGSSRTVTAENILIAVGTTPASPKGMDVNGESVITSDGVMKLKRLPRTMVVVGGGVIGIEYASIFSALGVIVTLVERRERPLEYLDREIIDELIHQMRNRKVTFRLGESVERLEDSPGPPRSAVTHLESGKRIVSELVLFSIGRLGATESLNLEAVGLDTDERGRLKVDAQFRTSVPHIFAAGDVIGFPSLAATSSEQGRLAACHAFGVPAGPMATHFPIGIYSIPEVSVVGPPEHELTENKVPYETGVARYREIARGQILGDDSGLLKILIHREDRRLLGVHAIGTGVTELIHIGQAVLGLGGGLDYFMETVFNYPTLAECYKVAALDAFNKLSR
ncbi:MAG: Si-specific NAD(P)(+) transhydrogenase [Chloroflexi bacterium]|nr:Si-specific NAD(P)(+) transhydrogenase [Chloroflexota bacterium]